MFEIERKVSKVVLTEEGLFHYGSLPEDYSGPQLVIEVCHAILFSNEKSNIVTYTLYAPPAMNSARNLVAYKTADMYSIVPPVSENFGIDEEYKHRYPQDVKNNVSGMKRVVESDGKSKVMP